MRNQSQLLCETIQLPGLKGGVAVTNKRMRGAINCLLSVRTQPW